MTAGKVIELDWKVSLKIDAGKGIPTGEPGNAYLMLTNGPWEGCLAYDEFGDRMYWAKDAPNGIRGFTNPKAGQDVSDEHALYIQHYMTRVGVEWAVSYKLEALQMAIAAAARKNTHHPLREYLSSLVWDGEDRLKRWCEECLGAAPSAYASAVGTWWMISAVARALEPGCQADHMLLLEGEQGARKSTALRILAGEWYLPELPDVQGKDAKQLLNGRWIVECGELDTLRRASMTAVKDFITRQVDVYRKPYGRHMVRRPRSVVFAGTTNEYQSLSDPSGARRFWPIRCGQIDQLKLKTWRDQLWAESVHRFEAGERWWPTSELAEAITEEQEERFQEDSWTEIILAGAKRHSLAPFAITDCMNWLGVSPDKWQKSFDTRVGAILHKAGYRSRRARIDGRRVRQYAKWGETTAGSLAPESEPESDYET